MRVTTAFKRLLRLTDITDRYHGERGGLRQVGGRDGESGPGFSARSLKRLPIERGAFGRRRLPHEAANPLGSMPRVCWCGSLTQQWPGVDQPSLRHNCVADQRLTDQAQPAPADPVAER